MRPGALHRGRLYHVHHKRLYFSEVDTQGRLEEGELPHLRYGTGGDRERRLCPDKFPIGAVTQDPDAPRRAVFAGGSGMVDLIRFGLENWRP